MSSHSCFWMIVLFLFAISIINTVGVKRKDSRYRYIVNFSPYHKTVRCGQKIVPSRKPTCHKKKKPTVSPCVKKNPCSHHKKKPKKLKPKNGIFQIIDLIFPTEIDHIFTEDCSQADRRKYDTKLQFMAHLHHQVDEVGKPPYKPLDLKKIETMIESSKHLTAGVKSAVLGNEQSTQCSPLQLNDLSIDMEWNELPGAKGARTATVQARNAMNDIFENADTISSRVNNDGECCYFYNFNVFKCG